MRIAVLSGGFDPLHEGHLASFEAANDIADHVIVGVNSDAWLERKKGKAFQPLKTRLRIVESIKGVDEALCFNDDDGSACALLERVKTEHPNDEIIFMNGGDRTKENIPEMVVEGVKFKFGVGGENKMNSSSDFLKDWDEFRKQQSQPITNRNWGVYQVLQELSGTVAIKTKYLEVNPGKSLSYQRHQFRSEFWVVQEGEATVNLGGELLTLKEGGHIIIKPKQWHQLMNKTDKHLTVYEVQYGQLCEENDIERA